MTPNKEKMQSRRTKPNTTQIWNQRTLKALVNMFKDLKENMTKIEDQIGTSVENKTIKRSQMENLELKSAIPKMKNSLDVLNNVFIGDGSINLT